MKLLLCISLILSMFNIEASQAEKKKSYAAVTATTCANHAQPKTHQKRLYAPIRGGKKRPSLSLIGHLRRVHREQAHHIKQLEHDREHKFQVWLEQIQQLDILRKKLAQTEAENKLKSATIDKLETQLKDLRYASPVVYAEYQQQLDSPNETSSSSSEQSDDGELVEYDHNLPAPETPVSRSPVVSPHSPRSLSPVRTLGINSPTDTLAAAIARQQQKINEELLQRALESQQKSEQLAATPALASSAAPAATPTPALASVPAVVATDSAAPAIALAPAVTDGAARSGIFGLGWSIF